MKKSIFAILLLLMTTTTAMAEDGINHIELELGIGTTFGYNDIKDLENQDLGLFLHAEGRYEFSNIPITVGAFASFGLNCKWYYYDYQGIPDRKTIDYYSSNFMATCDYNFRVHSKIKLFAGAGVGVCKYGKGANTTFSINDYDYVCVNGKGSYSAAFMPRLGAVFFDHLRLTFGYKLQERANRSAFLNIGYVIRL